MTLSNYLEKNKINKKEFCKILEIDYSTLFLWLSGKRTPSLENALNIEEITNRKVKVKDLLCLD